MPHLTFAFLAFSAIVTIVYWRIPSALRPALLAIASSVFLAYLDLPSYFLLAGLTIVTYICARDRKAALFILAGLILLFCFIRVFLLIWHMNGLPAAILFIGFAFYFLKLLHYTIEMRNQSFRPHTLLEFYNYMLFFPTITIGPIHRFEEFLKSERRIHWDQQTFARGLERMLYGYTKVIVLANWVADNWLVKIAQKTPEDSRLRVFLDSAVYGFHLYFSFAGYSDIAIGLGLLLGYKICENFDRPFLKRNIGEFWQSWHMSLSSWCRQYVFMPVYSTWRNLAPALLCSMVAIGLWHEFSIRYLFWGLYHGIGLVSWRFYNRYINVRLPVVNSRLWSATGMALSTALTFIFVMVGFTIPRSSSISEMIFNLHKLIVG